MRDKLKLLLEQIHFPINYYNYFGNGNLVKIISNKNKDSYIFVVQLENILPTDVYDLFLKHLKEKYSEFKYISTNIEVLNKDNTLINEYYKYVINENKKQNPLLESFINYKTVLDKNTFSIECANIAEKMKLDTIKEDLQKTFSSAGFGNFEIKININDTLNENLLEEVKQSLVIEVPKQEEVKIEQPIKNSKFNPMHRKVKTEDSPNVVLGRTIDNTITSIKNIKTEIDNVTIEANVFGIDYFESSKSNFKIITLKLTDFTDSMYCKIFTKDDEEYNSLKSKLKQGKFYKISGYIKNDIYSKELVLNARNINIVDKKIEKRKDNAEVKRVELHAHTMMSQMDGLTKLDLGKHTCELVSRTMEMGYRGVAITDHNGCQAFPIAYGIINSYNKNLKKQLKQEKQQIEDKLKAGDFEEPKEELEKKLEEINLKIQNPPIFKGLYGTELTLVDDTVNIVVRPSDLPLSEYNLCCI